VSDETTELDDAHEALDDARRRLADVPAEVVITNHVMGLYELAAIHLSTEPPDLASSRLAIDSVNALVEGLGDRLGADAETLRHALANIQMAFVEVKRRTDALAEDHDGPTPAGDDVAPPATDEAAAPATDQPPG
jgi:hypothetical protein